MSFRSKVDALDFVINILIDHQKMLENVVERLEYVTKEIEDMIMREKYDSIHISLEKILTEILGKAYAL